MGNVDDRDAGSAQRNEAIEKKIDLPAGNNRGRLIEYQDFDGANERPCNFDHLLIGDRQLIDPSAHVDLGAQPAKNVVRAALHQPVVDDAKPGERLIIDERVFSDCEFREEHELLVDDVDACTLRLARAGPRNLITVQLDFALVRNIGAGNDLDERALPGSIFANECMNLAGAD